LWAVVPFINSCGQENCRDCGYEPLSTVYIKVVGTGIPEATDCIKSVVVPLDVSLEYPTSDVFSSIESGEMQQLDSHLDWRSASHWEVSGYGEIASFLIQVRFPTIVFADGHIREFAAPVPAPIRLALTPPVYVSYPGSGNGILDFDLAASFVSSGTPPARLRPRRSSVQTGYTPPVGAGRRRAGPRFRGERRPQVIRQPFGPPGLAIRMSIDELTRHVARRTIPIGLVRQVADANEANAETRRRADPKG
jgi:hypothetical protein